VAENALSKIKKLQEQVREFVEETGIEHDDPTRRPRLFRIAHFWLLVGKSFVRNRCPVRAAALAYTTLLALIPMLAVVFSVMTGVLKSQGEAPIRMAIDKFVDSIAPYTSADAAAGDEQAKRTQALAAEKREEAVRKINEFIKNTQSSAIGVTGMIALVAVAISMLRRIESAFNDIWGVTRGRSWYTQVMLYWAVLSLGPLLFVVALGLSSGPHLEWTKKFLMFMPFVGNLVFKFLPALVLSVMFGMFYQLMPNTRVQPVAALAGGLVAGLLWNLNNVLGVNFVSRVTSNNAIYGSLGMVPVFMIGLYLGWIILLFGGQVAYAFQNRGVYLQEKQAESVNQRGREFVALRLMTQVAQCFRQGAKPPTAIQLGTALGVPTRLISQVVQVLVQSRLLVEAQNKEAGYMPARPLEQITMHDILHALRAGVGQELATHDDEARARVRSGFQQVCLAEKAAAEALTLAALADSTTPLSPAQSHRSAG